MNLGGRQVSTWPFKKLGHMQLSLDATGTFYGAMRNVPQIDCLKKRGRWSYAPKVKSRPVECALLHPSRFVPGPLRQASHGSRSGKRRVKSKRGETTEEVPQRAPAQSRQPRPWLESPAGTLVGPKGCPAMAQEIPEPEEGHLTQPRLWSEMAFHH